MTTSVEKLVFQIFERKKWIVEQVKQQTYLYEQHLASNLLIQGINPPPWFLNPNSHSFSSDPKELSKEELISGLLLPHARATFPYSTGQCYLQRRQVATGDNGQLLDKLPKDIQDSNKDLDARDEPRPVYESHGNDVGYTSNCVPRRSYTPSHDQAEGRVTDISIKSGQSQGRSQRSQQVVMQDSGKVSAGLHMVVHASNKGLDGGMELMNLPDSRDTDPGCTSNYVPKCSPADQTEARISNIDIAPDQSLSRFLRSKSRQKDLELRTSAKATNSCLRHENKKTYSGVALYGIDPEEPDHSKDLMVITKSSDTNKGSCGERVASRDLSNENGTSNNCGKITRSKSTCRRPISVNEPLKLDLSHENMRKDSGKESSVTRQAKGIDRSMENGAGDYCGQITRSKSSCIQQICLNESLEIGRSSTIQCKDGGELSQCMDNGNLLSSKETKAVIPFHVSKETSYLGEEAAMEKCKVKKQESSKYLDRMTRSMGSSQKPISLNDSANDAVGLDASSYIPKVGGNTCGEFTSKLNQQLDKANEVLEVVKPSTEFDGIMKNSEKNCGNEGPVLSIKSSSTADLKVTHSRSCATEDYQLVSSSNRSDGNGHKDLSGSKLILPVTETSAIFNEEKVPSATTIESEGQPPCFGYNLDNVNLRSESEALVARLASDAPFVVQPKHLDFDVFEDCSLNDHNPLSVKKSLEQSSQRTGHNLSEPEASLEKSTSDYPSKVSLEKQLMGQSEASKEKNKDRRPAKTNMEECSAYERTLEPYINGNSQVNHDEDDSEAELHICHSPNEKDVSPSDLHTSSYLDMHQPHCHITEGCPEQRIDEGYSCCKRWTRSEILPLTSQQQCSGSSAVPSLTKLATEAPESCLDKEENMKNQPDNVLDASRCCSADDENNLLQHKHSFDCKNIDNLVSTEKMALVEGYFNLVEEGLNTGLNTSGSVGDHQDEDKTFGCLVVDKIQPTYMSSLPETRSRHTKVDSWPQFKRRKIEDRQTNCFSASLNFRVQKLHNFQGGHINSHSKTIENELDAGSQLPAISSSRDLFHEKMECNLTDGTLSWPILKKSQQEEGEFCFEEQIKVVETPCTSEHEELEPCFVSSLSKQATRDSQGSFFEDHTTSPARDILAAKHLSDEQESQKFFHVGNVDDLADADILTFTRSALLDSNSHLKEGGLVGSPCNKELAFDPNLPVYEGFALNEHSDDAELDTSRDGINFGELNTTCSSMQRASILEQICRTASMCTPLSHFSSTYKPLKNKDLYLSLPNGLLEHTDITSTLSFSDDADNQLRATFTDEVDSTLRGMLYSDYRPYSGARYGWNSKKSDTPPAGKYCERISSSSFSSEKRLSSNPELICFPIKEDICVDDENENADEDDDNIQEDIGLAEINSCANGEALFETKEVFPNPPASVSQAEKFHHIGGLDSSNTEIKSSVKQRLRNHCSNGKSKNWGKENQLSSVGANSIKKVSESLHNRLSKAKLSGTTSIKRGSQRLSEKVKRNNIVSNVTSFIPLVQQKQAAAVCKGKRDIKVRALEAAEAAKRLEEKKENERKIKKEALKLERAKIEQETLRQRELDKIKKEEELKKKGADIAARKRLREEEGRKERERKRKRIGVGWQTHRAQEEKVIAGKGEKEKQCGNTGKNTNHKKESNNRTGKDRNMDNVSGDGNTFKKSESQIEFKTTASNIQQVSTVPENCETLGDCDGSRESTSMLDQLPSRSGVATKTSREKSYEMSPYQHSDDEDEEEDVLSTKKFIPSWASRNCVALFLCSQQQIDPGAIFPRESFCRMDEVLLPRHLH